MGGRGGSMGGSHGMGGGAGGAAKAAAPAAPVVQAVAPPKPKPKQTREQQLLAQIKGNPAALMQMSDQDAADTVRAIDNLPIAKDGTQNDTFVQRYMSLVGWDANKPTVLSEAAYEKARQKAGEESMYHADNASSAAVGKKMNQQLLSGKQAYYSQGVHGAGTYWAQSDAGGSGGYGQYQVKAFLNGKARPITTYQLKQDFQQLRRRKPKLYNALAIAKRGSYGGNPETMYPILAAARGKNVILDNYWGNSTQRSARQYVVTLDRSALTMSSKTIANADGYTPNW